MKAAAKLKSAQRSGAQSRVGIVDIGCGVGCWTDKHDPHAEAAGAWVEADNGSRRHPPIAQERRGLRRCRSLCRSREGCCEKTTQDGNCQNLKARRTHTTPPWWGFEARPVAAASRLGTKVRA